MWVCHVRAEDRMQRRLVLAQSPSHQSWHCSAHHCETEKCSLTYAQICSTNLNLAPLSNKQRLCKLAYHCSLRRVPPVSPLKSTRPYQSSYVQDRSIKVEEVLNMAASDWFVLIWYFYLKCGLRHSFLFYYFCSSSPEHSLSLLLAAAGKRLRLPSFQVFGNKALHIQTSLLYWKRHHLTWNCPTLHGSSKKGSLTAAPAGVWIWTTHLMSGRAA